MSPTGSVNVIAEQRVVHQKKKKDGMSKGCLWINAVSVLYCKIWFQGSSEIFKCLIPLKTHEIKLKHQFPALLDFLLLRRLKNGMQYPFSQSDHTGLKMSKSRADMISIVLWWGVTTVSLAITGKQQVPHADNWIINNSKFITRVTYNLTVFFNPSADVGVPYRKSRFRYKQCLCVKVSVKQTSDFQNQLSLRCVSWTGHSGQEVVLAFTCEWQEDIYAALQLK